MRRTLALWFLLLPSLVFGAADKPFAIKEGDTVVFYGDSITDQRLYTTFAETFAVTRFPHLNATFVHSGWGGDRVTGGGGGPIDRRLDRDVITYKPTVMTIMLGMNDASYRAFDEKIFETYSKGYEHILDRLKKALPNLRLTLIVPSPFDDVTRKPNFEGGYNAVLLKYGEFVKALAEKNGANVADLNTSVVEATKKAFAADAKLAEKLNPDRVHPAPAGQLLMAAALLRAWNAPALVSSVEIDAADKKVEARKATVENLNIDGKKVTWSQLDEALPFPVDAKDEATALALKSSSFVKDLNQQPLVVKGLAAGSYELKIDGKPVGTFSAEELARGINLAELPTPMQAQAKRVHELTLEHNNMHFYRWRSIQVPMKGRVSDEAIEKAMVGLDAVEYEISVQQRSAAKPKKHSYELTGK